MTATVTKLRQPNAWTQPGDPIDTREDAIAALLWLRSNAKHVRAIGEKCKPYAKQEHILHSDEWWGCGIMEREVKANLTLAELTNIMVEAGVPSKKLQSIREALQAKGVGSTKEQEHWCWRRLYKTETKAKLVDPPTGMTNKKGEVIS